MNEIASRWAPVPVDVRFAGGPVIVERASLPWDAAIALVTVEFPGYEVSLFPHEAAELAKALQQIAEA